MNRSEASKVGAGRANHVINVLFPVADILMLK